MFKKLEGRGLTVELQCQCHFDEILCGMFQQAIKSKYEICKLRKIIRHDQVRFIPRVQTLVNIKSIKMINPINILKENIMYTSKMSKRTHLIKF